MRRFLTLVSLLFLAVPAGISVTGCYRNPGANYCNGLGYGLKIGDVASITLQPQTTGISLAFGQTQQIATPSAYDCKGSGANVGSWSYGTTNNKLVDLSPSGMICAGTWNRNSGGGIADYTTCNKPDPLPTTNGLPYLIAYITASGDSVTSNPVKVFVHTQVTSIALAVTGTPQCYSQTQTQQLDAQACYSALNSAGTQYAQYLFCAPAGTPSASYACPLASGVSAVPSCSASLGALTYAVGNSSIGSLNSDTNVITAVQPGTSNITATIAGSASSAGYFSVCPPQTVTLKTSAGTTAATVTQGVSQTLVSSVVDTAGHSINGLTLDYQSTNPIDISVAGGTISSVHPGVASIYASCQSPSCNPSPINELGLYGTGLPTVSNTVTITTPGTTSDFVWFGAPNQSQYFVSIDLLTGTSGSTVKLPYVPNSMIMDKTGSNLYFGSSHGLMVYSTSNNAITSQNNNVPGLLLGVSPANNYALINDQTRGLLYLYSIGSSTSQTFNGMVAAVTWTADSKTMYAVDSASLGAGHSDTLYIYSQNTGWSTEALPCSVYNAVTCPNPVVGPQNLTATIPGMGAYLSGNPTTAYSWCPAGAVGSTASMVLFPSADTQPVQTDVLAATTDGNHILGAAQVSSSNVITLTDLGLTIPTTTVGSVAVPVSCVPGASATAPAASGVLSALSFTSTKIQTALNPLGSTAINQVVTSPVSNLTFITYSAANTNTGAKLPFYLPGTKGTLGPVGYVTLSGSSAVTAPLAGAFTPDNSMFFVSTQGDNLIHFLTIPTGVSIANPPVDTKTLAPALPACSAITDSGCTQPGTGIVPATVITVIPRATT